MPPVPTDVPPTASRSGSGGTSTEAPGATSSSMQGTGTPPGNVETIRSQTKACQRLVDEAISGNLPTGSFIN